ncbi:MAG: phage major tail protein, TP901-1 family [Alphaproteobacteria bacterium]|nr:phage major tail protein, TP901-1 family [Alphaproteobacteria bacterium]
MPAHRGLDILLKLGDGGAPETYSAVAGLRVASLSLNAETVDATSATSPGRWRELLAGAGVRAASVSGAGVFVDDAVASAVRALFFGDANRNWRLEIPGLGAITGAFALTNLDYAGEYDGEATVSLSLASAGALAFEAA